MLKCLKIILILLDKYSGIKNWNKKIQLHKFVHAKININLNKNSQLIEHHMTS